MRIAPKPVPPISHQGILYRIEEDEDARFGQSGGVIQAIDVENNQEIWMVRVYQIIWDPEMEKDVQEVYIREMLLDDTEQFLLITDERQRRYRVALADGAVQAQEPA